MEAQQRWLDYVAGLHDRLAQAMPTAAGVRAAVDLLLPMNSFKESCFCKGLVLPVLDAYDTEWLAATFGARASEVYRAQRCEGYDTPLYSRGEGQSGFSAQTHTKTPFSGTKSGGSGQSRRSPDFCLRFRRDVRCVGETKYALRVTDTSISKLVAELRDYLAIKSDPLTDWGHDFGYGIAFAYDCREGMWHFVRDYWTSDRIALSVFR